MVALVAAIIDREVDREWLVAVLVSGALSLFLAYLVQIDLALAASEPYPSDTH